MICAMCEERMSISFYYVVREMDRDHVECEYNICSSYCIREWFK